jgi:hypothetical protein
MELLQNDNGKNQNTWGKKDTSPTSVHHKSHTDSPGHKSKPHRTKVASFQILSNSLSSIIRRYTV